MEWMLMPLKRYADFSGRSRRQEYWMFVLFVALLYSAGIVIAIAVGAAEMSAFDPKVEQIPGATMIVILLFGVVYIGLFIPTLAVQVRRFHDQDLSGWLVLLGFIPYVGWLIVLIFMCIDGTPGPNRFGPDPQGRGDSHASIFA